MKHHMGPASPHESIQQTHLAKSLVTLGAICFEQSVKRAVRYAQLKSGISPAGFCWGDAASNVNQKYQC